MTDCRHAGELHLLASSCGKCVAKTILVCICDVLRRASDTQETPVTPGKCHSPFAVLQPPVPSSCSSQMNMFVFELYNNSYGEAEGELFLLQMSNYEFSIFLGGGGWPLRSLFIFIFVSVLEIKLRALGMLDKHAAPELQSKLPLPTPIFACNFKTGAH